MTPDRQVYLLDPQSLPPETIAVTFAKTSRSPESFREIAAELTDEKSARFHEKWVVGYGHSSVAEHAVLHIAVENISRLAVETLESNRLASYTEKSTRYQTWNNDAFFVPPELEGHLLRQMYMDTCCMLFDAYQQALPKVKAVIEVSHPREEGESEARWEARIRSHYVDVCRFFLPAAALANVGMTINARALEHAIQKMLSHPLQEVRQIGEEIKAVAKAETPTLVKYADALPHLQYLTERLSRHVRMPSSPADDDWCRLISCDRDGEERVLAAAVYRFSGGSFDQALNQVRALNAEQRTALVGEVMATLTRHDIPIRELEYSRFTFDLILDQGAYFELKRHRMMTQTPQNLTTRLGYTVPTAIVKAGLVEHYVNCMDACIQAYEQLAPVSPHVAAYVVPNAFRRRVLLEFNLRTARHFLQLRMAENAHFSMRRVAVRMLEEIQHCSPLFGQYLSCPTGETWQQIEGQHFAVA